MRQETINIYTIEDHPNPEKCYEWIRNNWHDLGQHCVDEMIDSLKTLARETNGSLDYALSIVSDRGEFVKITDYSKAALVALHNKKDECPLTGVSYDIDIIEGLYKDDLENVVLTTLHNEGDYLYSDEGLKEMCLANEYEFLEDGSRA